ncbi:MAG: hypothetical protein KC455_08245 [Carnobacterium sp.]|nr:hypothetical protein [Carnobacterium sp.]
MVCSKDIASLYKSTYENYKENNHEFIRVDSDCERRLPSRSADSIKKWFYFGEMAHIQEKIFNDINLKVKSICTEKDDLFKIHFDYVKEIIINFAKEQNIVDNEKKATIVEIDFKNIFYNNNNLDNYIESINKKINENSDETIQYVYVVFRNDGMVVVVGQTSTLKNSDLFKLLDTRGLTGSANIILRKEFGNELFEKFDHLLTNYYSKAWVFADPNNIKNIKECESNLGEYLKEKGVPILNNYSHLYN